MTVLPVPFDITELAPEKGAPDPARVLSGKPDNRVWNLYTSPDGKFFSGIWESEPGASRIEYTEHEFCHILDGVSRIVPAGGGEPMTVQKGDAFVIPAGFKGVWEVIERTRKHYAIYEA